MTAQITGEIQNATIGGFIEAIEEHSRRHAFVKVALVAGVVALKPTGPTRLMFSGGGHIDVTGNARHWALLLRIHEIEDSSPVASASHQNRNTERQ